MSARDPKGVLAILTAPDGGVIATAADFQCQAPGGSELWEGQLYRARRQVKFAAVRAYCSSVVVEAISAYLAEQVCDALIQKGHRLTFRAIGWSAEATAMIER